VEVVKMLIWDLPHKYTEARKEVEDPVLMLEENESSICGGARYG